MIGGYFLLRRCDFGRYYWSLAAIFISILLTTAHGAAAPYMAVDARSGQIVAHKDAFQKWYPASLTKLMTAYIVFREIKAGRLSMRTELTMSAHAAGQPASKMYFKPGTRFSVDSALKYLLVKSANDVAVAIGEHISGSDEKFVAYMNQEAKRLGMVSTRFANPNGLPGGAQYTNARDMAFLALAIKREFPRYQSYFSMEGFSAGGKTYGNYNLLLGRFSGANGMKTGYICASGFNLVASAKRSGRTIIAVVLGAKSQKDRAELSAHLLQSGFSGEKAGVTLDALQPYGNGRNQLKDIRNQICTAQARAVRGDERDVDGKLIINSAYLRPMRRASKIVTAPFKAALSNTSPVGPVNSVPLPAKLPRR